MKTGQYHQEKVEERISQYYDINEVEDELHFISQCTLHEPECIEFCNHLDIDEELNSLDNIDLEAFGFSVCKNIFFHILENLFLSFLTFS